MDMHIAFDAKRLFFNASGLGNYSRSLVANIRESDRTSEITLFTPSVENSPYVDFLQGQYQLCQGDGRFLWRLKNMVKDLSRLEPDIYHGLSNELPVGIANLEKTKSIVTIHDLIFLRYPEFYPISDRIIYREKCKRACKRANHIIAVSQATKADIVAYFEIPSEKITVIYQACSKAYYEGGLQLSDAPPGRPYVLFVSSITERKNLKLLLNALQRIRKTDRPLLRVVGAGGRYEDKMKELAKELALSEDVEFMGRLADDTLRSLYRNAEFTVYPSLCEGFGIPIVESMLMGTPVIASNTSAMPEAACGLARLIDPTSVEELESAMIDQMSGGSRLSMDEVELIRGRFDPKSLTKEILHLYKSLV